ncbi:MAG: hypothetical protein JWQ76_2660 [Ramlibacter sp.]|nr:hypothetical protein [Ramlibacter sp.]
MKYLLLFALLFIAYLVWRNGRLADRGGRPRQSQQPAAPQDMVSCPVCAVHLPRSEAVADANGVLYCSQEHRLKAGEQR